MSDQRNLILAVVLSLGILLGWDYFFASKVTPLPEGQAPVATSVDGTQTQPVVQTAQPVAPSTMSRTREEALADSGPRVAIHTEKLNGSIRLTGALIDDLTLATYRETVDKDSAEVTLLSPRTSPHPYYADFGWRAQQGVRVPDVDSQWTADGLELGVNRPVTLTWDNEEGLRFIRKVQIDKDYMFTVTQTVVNNTDKPINLASYGMISRERKPPTVDFFILHEGMVGTVDGALQEIDYDDMIKDKLFTQNSEGGWLGITDKYWLTALVPDQTRRFDMRFSASPVHGVDDFRARYDGDTLTVPAGGSVSVENRLFAGAKEFDLLSAYQSDLKIPQFRKAIDFGWFWILTVPFTWALHHLYQLLGNMGLSIIAFTIVLKIVFFPLANKSYRSMSKLKLLGPEMKKLQERFKDDRVRLNQEMMALYSKEKVNPFSGCLPILLQIPVFFALYKVIFVNIDMRHAPFVGWINDLSARESITVFNLFGLIPWTPAADSQIFWVGSLALIMGFTMWLQQKLNPAPTDPTQAKIMALLPFIFTFVLAQFASGLILYWTTNNILSIMQQWLIMKRLDRQKKAASKVG